MLRDMIPGPVVMKIIELLNHGETPERISDVEGVELSIVKNIALLVSAKSDVCPDCGLSEPTPAALNGPFHVCETCVDRSRVH